MNVNFWLLQNQQCALRIEKTGGNIVDFQLKDKDVNPLNFQMLHQTPYHEDVYFKGHFLCLGRWGDPSQAELERGLNKHGEFVRLNWQGFKQYNLLNLSATSPLEGLSVSRKIQLSEISATYKVTDHISNENILGRMYQVVQHPTISTPFLNENTVIDCNASSGFDYAYEKFESAVTTQWPYAYSKNGIKMKLDKPDVRYSSVFPFIVQPDDQYGWITAFSPGHQLLIGYIWKRKDYPWINHWLHWEEVPVSHWSETRLATSSRKPLYRGLEFGNTGMHKPFHKILSENLISALGESSFDFIEPGDIHTRSFYSFIHSLPQNFAGIERVDMNEKNISIYEKFSNKAIVIPHTFN